MFHHLSLGVANLDGPEMARLQLTRATVRARIAGEGQSTIVFVCDAPVCIEHHAGLVEELKPRRRVVILELPGLGFSLPTPGFGYSLDEQSLVVQEALECLNLGPYTLARQRLPGAADRCSRALFGRAADPHSGSGLAK